MNTNKKKKSLKPRKKPDKLIMGIVFLFIAIVATIFILVLPDNKENKTVPEAYKFTKDGSAAFTSKDGKKLCDFVIEIADTPDKMKTGLMYMDSLSANQAMLFLYDKPDVLSFWMKNTYLPLDIIFIGADSSVVSVAENTTPFSEVGIQSKGPALLALEVNAGVAKKYNLIAGTKFSWKRD
jgi:uncharacterized membrane protein (UPF0127 family)